ncbi:MAG: DUF1854 domain-containing protein [candidate division KSB1 bacterium]|nr:DUF1854 domain-containing protein [candidate division KSB1 bacterium]MDZ7305188.1 DUF1854 domain-containing protein [candidate division KSB1 bacterium]MDZ7314282.1 DUF1854 domain-containing protein [candidate division KSB1 bacterium]
MTTVLETNLAIESAKKEDPNGQAGNLVWSLSRRADGRLVLRQKNETGETVETPVQVACCFPWSRPHEFISLRDDKGKEQLLLENLQPLDATTRELIEDELAERNFLPRITGIEAITDEMELFHWKVRTTAGPRSFLTRRSDYPRKLTNGDVLIKDVSNDLYLIPNPKGLDAKSVKLLWVYLD